MVGSGVGRLVCCCMSGLQFLVKVTQMVNVVQASSQMMAYVFEHTNECIIGLVCVTVSLCEPNINKYR